MEKKAVINEKSINYYECGSGQEIVFIHGWGRSHEDFMPVINEFGLNYRLIAIDLPGHGKSDDPDGDLSIQGLTDTIEQFLNEINVTDPILICHSFGARIAIKLASQNKVSNKLIFTGGAGIEKKSLGFKLKVINYKIMKFLVKTPMYSQYKDDLFANSGSEDYKNASPTMKRVLSLAVTEDLSSELALINNQTLLYWGEKDDATPLWHGEMMNKKITNSTLIVKENLTHYAFLEAKDDFYQVIKTFIGGENE